MIHRDLLLKCEKNIRKIIGDLEKYSEVSITSDSRKIENKNTFVALYGERFDAFQFIEEILESKISIFIFEEGKKRESIVSRWSSLFPHKVFIFVSNIFSFLLELAHHRAYAFKHSGGQVIALTGSNGKTTNKEMLLSLLGAVLGHEKIHATRGNLNNHIGVPFTLFGLEDIHRVAIIEMGTNHFGEIEELCDCVKPDFGMITNIGDAHLEFFKDREGVFKEKRALFESIEKSTSERKIFIVNGFDEKLRELPGRNWSRVLSRENLQFFEKGFSLRGKENLFRIENKTLLGEHQYINMAMCLLMGEAIFPKKGDLLTKAANSFCLRGMNRGEILSWKEKTVYLDAYNANPSSMRASLQSFKKFLSLQGGAPSDALIIIGDMNEVGEKSSFLHGEIALFLERLGFEKIYAVGKFADYYKEANPRIYSFADLEGVQNHMRVTPCSLPYVFAKASRSLRLEKLFQRG